MHHTRYPRDLKDVVEIIKAIVGHSPLTVHEGNILKTVLVRGPDNYYHYYYLLR